MNSCKINLATYEPIGQRAYTNRTSYMSEYFKIQANPKFESFNRIYGSMILFLYANAVESHM